MVHNTVLAAVGCIVFSVSALAQTAPKAPTTPTAPGTPTLPSGTPNAPAGALPGAMPGMTPDMQKMWEQMQQQLLSRFDADRNGMLNDQERLMAQEAMRREGINLGIPPGGFPGSDQFLKQFDRDGDGKLNPIEAFAAQEAFQRSRNGGGGGMRGALRGGGGGGGGSAIPQQPLVAQPNATDNKSTKSGSALVKRFDKDGDGKLNAEEKAAAQAELKKGKGKDAKKDGEGKKE